MHAEPAADFPDPRDGALFPRLTPSQLRDVAELAERRMFEAEDTLFEQG